MTGITPSQTIGPFFAYGLTPDGKYAWVDTFSNNLITSDTSGERIRVEGQVFDGDGKVVPDAMIEIWQADAQGRFSGQKNTNDLPNTSFTGFGRNQTNPDGSFHFDTIKPGAVPDPDGKLQAPHILMVIFARGMTLHNYTRIYFEGETGNATDLVLGLVPKDRRATLIAKRDSDKAHPVYRFDVHLQGDNETVFFDI